tara:strand:- start:3057 stop:4196 length:1140 start_codon:yes stop_codon:yes gene_type:complete
MTAVMRFFPVDNGDMTLIELESGRFILVDINIRSDADDLEGENPDVSAQLRRILPRDGQGRLYVDAFLLSHPDQDHCRGLVNHFHLGPPNEWTEDDDKILIREMWSSPVVFRRASRNHALCDDAKAWNREARRRVDYYRKGGVAANGERILILGEDENGKTDDLTGILVKIDETFSRVNGAEDATVISRLLAPLPINDKEEKLSKNKSSTILQFSLAGGGELGKCLYLTGGDAEVAIWEKLWLRHAKDPDVLTYDVLLTPHHCSWRSLSYDSWSDNGEDARVCLEARNALSQTNPGATLIASSKPVLDDKNDPPCIRAKREYYKIASDCKGTFECVGDSSPKTLEIEVGINGPKLRAKVLAAATIVGAGVIGSQPVGHG